ncbi:TetR/AcrR family transcriptional regulator [Mycobacterium sp. 21AC1]|uniref:TetR/AcrR family transcriptional regulator n=1 Tax=[Mycobacterium] appelbergii TaxID=2939269 RepID=UPI0029392090|nr:TetR/AcrR family transcriptional regulator [Mycobacterium sp. 21AC1]MDV3130301.1 TetR/AcrR family transcriptional regulator [Mycobacterium sp. 21AC1]
MPQKVRHPHRRNQVLSRDRIIEVAVEVLDTGGESALTLRTITDRLATGSGAVYYRVGTRDELLDAATEAVISAVLADQVVKASDTPKEAILGVALALFDAVAVHQWLATRLTIQIVRHPLGHVTVSIFERIGRQVQALGVSRTAWFDTTSTIVHYILGAVSQHARVGAAATDGGADRQEFLDQTAAAWHRLPPEQYPFMHAIVDQMRTHEDRQQFLTGMTIIMDGLPRSL